VQAPLKAARIEESVIDHLADFARWDRIFTVPR
jgi:hypothetical protein